MIPSKIIKTKEVVNDGIAELRILNIALGKVSNCIRHVVESKKTDFSILAKSETEIKPTST